MAAAPPEHTRNLTDRRMRPVSSPALHTYLEGADPAATKLLTSLDESIRAACPDLDVAIKYGILMYGLRGDWRTWICALQATKKGVSLKFLYGVLLDDPLRVLRSGSSVLMSWDFGTAEVFVCPSVRQYVAEAVAKYDQYKATAPQVLEASRGPRRRARPGRSRRRSNRPGLSTSARVLILLCRPLLL